MPLAVGADSRLRMAPESSYGTQPGGNWRNFPFNRFTLDATQPLIVPDTLGLATNRDPARPFRDGITVAGQVEVPIDLVYIGHWFRLVFGVPVTTGTGPFTHTFISGAATIPSNSIEMQFPAVPNFAVHRGVRAESIGFSATPTGEPRATLALVAQRTVEGTTSVAGTVPAAPTYTPFSALNGRVTRNGSTLGFVTGAEFTYSNALDPLRDMRGDGLISELTPSITSMTGTLDMRFENTTLLTQAIDGTSCELALIYEISGTQRINFIMHEVYLERRSREITGPRGVQISFGFRAAFNAGQTRAMNVVLVNDQAGTVYA